MTDELAPARVLDPETLLEVVRVSVAKLLAETAELPTALRVVAGPVSIELEWSRPEPSGSAVQALATGPGVLLTPPEQLTPQSPGPGAAVGLGAPTDLLTSPTVGVFYRSPTPGAAPFVTAGDVVSVGQQIGIIEAMKLLFPVEASRAGTILEALVGDGTGVEYGQKLFRLASLG
jgi:acetyl-CoA carboxylase biotin carboxyl carrier protein